MEYCSRKEDEKIMAQPISFPEQNMIYNKPVDMTDEECSPLPTLTDGSTIVSCWQLSPEELEHIQKTGVIWLGVLGYEHPPVFVTAISPIIKEEDK